ncbi:MAG: glycosyltransferase [Proteobacteria bacterium]|nr:glycosyltransferase [Pseudomonadota bacterium]
MSRIIHSDYLASIIIPTHCYRQRSILLKRCLNALSHQTLNKECFEVFVVNNRAAEKDLWDKGLLEFKDQLNLRILHEVQKGSYAARNYGAALAHGKILAFLDSDCIPVPGWLKAGLEMLQKGGPRAVVGGRIKKVGRGEKLNLIEKHEKIFTLNQRKNVISGQFAATANLLVYRDFFVEVGPFNSGLLASGDVEWGYRAREKGGKFFYSAQACITHPVVNSISEVVKRYRRKAGGYYSVQKTTPKALQTEVYLGFRFLQLKKKKNSMIHPLGILHGMLNIIQRIEIVLCCLGKSQISG